MAAAGGLERTRVPALDGIRALAALMVFVHHAEVPGVWVVGFDAGVLLFFSLSGYLLYQPFLDGNVDLRNYAIRRVLRIVPAYLVAVLGVGALYGISDPLGILTMSHTPLVVAWTLQIEVVFYLLLPLIATVARDIRPLLLLAAASLLSTVVIMAVSIQASGIVRSTDLQTFASMAWAFVPGMIVAIVRPTRLSLWVLGLGVAMIGVSVAVDIDHYADIPAAVGSGLVVAFAVSRPNLPGRWAQLAIGAGALSYSFYLWHHPFIMAFNRPTSFGGIAIAFLGTLAVSAVVYLLMERPAIKLGRRLSRAKEPDRERGLRVEQSGVAGVEG